MKKQSRFQRPTGDPCGLIVGCFIQGVNASPPIGRLSFARRGEGENSLTDSYAAILARHLNLLPFARAETSKGHKASLKKAGSVSMSIAFLRFSIHRDSMGQQLRIRIKRKRRLAYLRRKNAARRVAATRMAPVKQPAQKESAASK